MLVLSFDFPLLLVARASSLQQSSSSSQGQHDSMRSEHKLPAAESKAAEQQGDSDGDTPSPYRGLHMSSALVCCQLRTASSMPMLLEPTDRQFLHVAGELTVPIMLLSEDPALPAANTTKKSGWLNMNASTSLAAREYTLQSVGLLPLQPQELECTRAPAAYAGAKSCWR